MLSSWYTSPPQKKTGKELKCCPRGHKLYWDSVAERCNGNAEGQLLACDSCSRHIRHPCLTAVCWKCNFDLCAKCYDSVDTSTLLEQESLPAVQKASQRPKQASLLLPTFCTPELSDMSTIGGHEIPKLTHPSYFAVPACAPETIKDVELYIDNTDEQRYNRVRPRYGSDRVSYRKFPDPTDYGWVLTGSSAKDKVAFYERVLDGCFVKLDFYYTTGTIRTVLEHPTLGVAVLFKRRGANLSSDLYREVLQNPLIQPSLSYRIEENENMYTRN